MDHVRRTSPPFKLGSPSSTDDRVTTGEHPRFSLHPRVRIDHSYPLDIVSAFSFVVCAVAGEPNADR